MAIEVYAELACPFTHFALRRIVERRAQQGRAVPLLRIWPWPLELVNGRPLDPDHVAAEVRAMRAQVSPDLFAGFDERALPSTSMAGFRLAEAGYDVDPGLGEQVSLALRDALFEQGRDIGDTAVLTDLATAHGLAVPGPALDDAVHRSHADGQRRGVVGSPHFFVGGASAFCPLLDISRDDGGEFHLDLDEVAADRLVDEWLVSEADR